MGANIMKKMESSMMILTIIMVDIVRVVEHKSTINHLLMATKILIANKISSIINNNSINKNMLQSSQVNNIRMKIKLSIKRRIIKRIIIIIMKIVIIIKKINIKSMNIIKKKKNNKINRQLLHNTNKRHNLHQCLLNSKFLKEKISRQRKLKNKRKNKFKLNL